MSLPGIMWLKAAASAAATLPTIVYGGANSTSAGISSGSLSLGIGTADPTRLVVVGIVDNSTTGVTAVTIGGITATKIIGISTGGTNASLWAATVTTGTTATVAFTLSSGSAGAAVVAWALYNLSSTTAVDKQSAAANPGSAVTSPATNTSSGGVAVAIGGRITTVSPAGSLSGSLAQDVAANYALFCGGCITDHADYAGAHGTTTGATITETYTGVGGDIMQICVASWR